MMKERKALSPQQAQAKLEDLCARAEHSSRELLDKLRRWGIAPSDADKIIASLKANRFVDDERFARAYVRDKVMFARWGRRKIRLGLGQKGITGDAADSALAAIDENTYEANLRNLLVAKVKSDPSLLESYESRTKLFRFAVSRGFETSLSASILKELISKK